MFKLLSLPVRTCTGTGTASLNEVQGTGTGTGTCVHVYTCSNVCHVHLYCRLPGHFLFFNPKQLRQRPHSCIDKPCTNLFHACEHQQQKSDERTLIFF